MIKMNHHEYDIEMMVVMAVLNLLVFVGSNDGSNELMSNDGSYVFCSVSDLGRITRIILSVIR